MHSAKGAGVTGLFVLVCLFFLFYFFGNRKFFFSSLEDFRVRDEAG